MPFQQFSPNTSTVLLVDDSPSNRILMTTLLQDVCRVRSASNGNQALAMLDDGTKPDLVILDIVMPDMDGFEVCRRIKANPETDDIPVIFLTAMSDMGNEAHGLDLGAVDYITKPISPPIVLSRIKTHLTMKSMRDSLRSQNTALESEVIKRTAEITAIQDVTVQTLACLAEARDSDTGNHIRRTQLYVLALANKLREHQRFKLLLEEPITLDLLFKSAALHDIGKVGVPDRILLKPGRLDFDEFEIMKTHTTIGHNAIAQAEHLLGISIPFLHFAKEIALGHHEKWDGSGYPRGLAGENIPLSARLMALADVYDALISRRVYKAPMPHEEAVRIIVEGCGSHFDPDVVDAFISLQQEFKNIAWRYGDSDEELARKAAQLARLSG